MRKNKIKIVSSSTYAVVGWATEDLGRNTLGDFLAIYGLKTGGKAELVACAFLAVELKLPNWIIRKTAS